MNQKEREYKRLYMQDWRARNRDRWNAYKKKHNRVVRLEVLTHYSGGSPQCCCCGEEHTEFLGIDHITGHGKEHRRGRGNALYHWLRRNKFPLGFRVLCHNCNLSMGFYGYCPHQKCYEG